MAETLSEQKAQRKLRKEERKRKKEEKKKARSDKKRAAADEAGKVRAPNHLLALARSDDLEAFKAEHHADADDTGRKRLADVAAALET